MSNDDLSLHRGLQVLVDSSAYLAVLNRRDTYHLRALSVRDRLVAQGCHLLTTNFVVAEAHGLLIGRLGHQIARRFLATLPETMTSIVRVTPADEQRAREIILRYDDKEFSLTDTLSFAVMDRLDVPAAFTFDRHFIQFGFQALGL